MRLLAVDQGSVSLGLAFFTGRELIDTRVIKARPLAAPWDQRMRTIAHDIITLGKLSPGWTPDLIAIEDVVLHRGLRSNPKTLAVMAQTRGYLARVYDELYPFARRIAISPQRVKSSVGAPQRRARAKQHIGWAVEALTGRSGLEEDEADAVALGYAALEQLRVEELHALPR